jgi:oligopeptide/dipeptide ABC transporter ATP-binding protein
VGGLLRRQIGTVYAVDGVDFDIHSGETFSLVGESGCGKTTLGRSLLRLTEPTAGTITFAGKDITRIPVDDLRPLRRRMQIIFQDPFGSLNPRMPISDIIGEGLLAQGVKSRKERDKKTEDALDEMDPLKIQRVEEGQSLLQVRGIKKHFPIIGGLLKRQIGTVYAVDGVDFVVKAGEVFSLVGESGCGKTTLGRTVIQLTPSTEGRVVFDGYELADVDPDDMRPLRRRMQIIFQDPFGSLNPRMPVSDLIGEGLLSQGLSDRRARDKRVEDSLELVGLRREYSRRYPHEFSGGQRQRIGVARALALGPDFIVADEPVSALDVSIQSQVLNLLLDLKRDLNLTYLFISHNLSVVQYFSDRVGVMYLGKIVEVGTVEQLYAEPRHPYTVALLSAIPEANPRRRKKRLVLKGDVPSPAAPPSGCRFHTRCWLRERLGNPENCVTIEPPLVQFGAQAGHRVACHWADQISQSTVEQAEAEAPAVVAAVAEGE